MEGGEKMQLDTRQAVHGGDDLPPRARHLVRQSLTLPLAILTHRCGTLTILISRVKDHHTMCSLFAHVGKPRPASAQAGSERRGEASCAGYRERGASPCGAANSVAGSSGKIGRRMCR